MIFRAYTLSGAYRKIVEKVTNMSWHFMHYSDPTATLIQSDIEELKGQPEPISIAGDIIKIFLIFFFMVYNFSLLHPYLIQKKYRIVFKI